MSSGELPARCAAAGVTGTAGHFAIGRAAAYLTSALVLLEDCHSSAMAAYGVVDPTLPGMLDPWLGDLETDVDALRQMVTMEADDGATA